MIPAEQKAIVQNGNGGAEVLSLQTVAVPEPGDGQVLIKVRASGVNPIDWKIREGMMPFPTHEPRIPGFDVAGEIVAVGANVTEHQVGDSVFAMIGFLPMPGLNGGYAEYAVASAGNTVAKPQEMSDAEAASLGTAGLAAARMLYLGGVSSGTRLFINGLSGSVGTIMAQLAVAAGATTIGTASPRHLDFLASIGVDEVIDYTTTQFVDVTEPVDTYAEAVANAHIADGIRIVRPGGRVVSVVGLPSNGVCDDFDGTCRAIGGPPGEDELTEPEYLRQLGALAESGRLKVRVDREISLADAADGQELNRLGQVAGKVILRP